MDKIATIGALRAYIAGIPDKVQLLVCGEPYSEMGFVTPIFEHYGLFSNGNAPLEDQFIVLANSLKRD